MSGPPTTIALRVGRGVRPQLLLVGGLSARVAGALAEPIAERLSGRDLFGLPASTDWRVLSVPDLGLVAIWREHRALTTRELDAANQAALQAWADVMAPGMVEETAERREIDATEVIEIPAAPKVLQELGPLVAVTYDGSLLHEQARYEHTFGEASRPTLASDEHGRLYVLGGSYTVTPRGITDIEE